MGKRSLLVVLLCIFAVALGIRVHFALCSTAKPDYSDMAWYNEVALQGGFPKELPPAYPLFLRAIYALFGKGSYRAVFVVQGFIGALTAAMIGWIGAKVGNLRVGATAGGIAALYPNFIVYSLTTLTETFGLFCVVALSVVLVAEMGERRRSIAAVLCLACGALFRPVILFFAPGVFFSVRKRGVFALACAVVVAPLVAYELSAGMTFQRAAVALYETYYPTLDGVGFIDPKTTDLGSDTLASEVYVKTALANVRANPWRAVGNAYNKGAVLFSRGWDKFVMDPVVSSLGNRSALLRQTHEPARPRVRDSLEVSADAAYVMEYGFVPVMLLGFVGMARLYSRRNRALVLPALSYVLLMILVCIFKLRYRLLVEPVFIIFASLLVWRTLARAGRRDARAASTVSPASQERAIGRGVAWALFAVALAVRLFAVIKYNPTTESFIATQLKWITQHFRPSSDSAPLYQLLVRTLYVIGGAGNGWLLFAVQAALGATIVFPMYWAAARLGNRWSGALAGLLSALYPAFIGYGLGIRTEWLTAVLVATLIAVGSSRLGERSRAALSAVVAGAAMLVQPLLTWLVPGAFAASRKRWVFLAVLAAVLLPFTVGNAVRTHRIVPVYTRWALGVNLGNINVKSGWSTIDRLYESANSVVTRGPISSTDQESRGALVEPREAWRYAYVIVMILGLIGLARYYRRDEREIVLPILGYILVLVVFTVFELNCRAALEPLLIVYASILLTGGRERAAPEAQSGAAAPPLI